MLKRTHKCGELRAEHIGQEVVISGWVANWRDHGGLIFVDLRDRYGVAQAVFNPQRNEDLHSRAAELRSEYCISVSGQVAHRPEGMTNPKLPTGEVEVMADQLETHSRSETPPFEVGSVGQVSQEVRLRYRFMDLRRPHIQRNLIFRHRLMQLTRRFLDSEGFIEVETPFLTKSTPEGARDYLVPSRLNPGTFYALPQSPQLFKQILMISGLDRYFQIVKCFRDEDLRAQRQPEFTQIDLEMSFVEEEDVLDCTERLMAAAFRELLSVAVSLPLPRLSYAEAMDRYGTDSPDLRFGLEICDITDIARECEFRVFSTAAQSGGQVRGLCVPGGGRMPRSEIDGLIEWVKQFGAAGLAWFKIADGKPQSGIAKFLTEGQLTAIAGRFEAPDAALLLFVADKKPVCDLTLSRSVLWSAGPSTPCVGFAMGVEATILAMEAELGPAPATDVRPSVYVVCFDETARAECLRSVRSLRSAGVRAEMDFEDRSPKAQMRAANNLNCPLCFLIGERELQEHQVLIKEMSGGKQWSVPAERAVEEADEFLKGIE